MKTSLKKTLPIIAAAPLLMAVLCEKVDFEPQLIANETRVTLSQGPSFMTNDTIWVFGRVSAMVFDEGILDSIRNPNETIQDVIEVFKLQQEDGDSNTTGALKDFDLIIRKGKTDVVEKCSESGLIAIGVLAENEANYEYEIGLLGNVTGDFVLSWSGPVSLENTNLNTAILENYPVKEQTNFLGLTNCGITSTIPDVEASRDEFFFTIN